MWHSRPRLCSAEGGNLTLDFDLRSNTAEGGCATHYVTFSFSIPFSGGG